MKKLYTNDQPGVKNTFVLVRIFLTLNFILGSVYCYSQENNYWQNAAAGEIKIYSISFTDSLNGKAVSGEGDVLFSSDGGTTWKLEITPSQINTKQDNSFFWKADIYCSVMHTIDGGITWQPYAKEKQEHFCGVYLKDNNTGYNIAEEFLGKISAMISIYIKKDEVNNLVGNPQQCTEYYNNPEEGWALGWCVKNYSKK